MASSFDPPLVVKTRCDGCTRLFWPAALSRGRCVTCWGEVGEELTEALMGVVNQACSIGGVDGLDSHAISVYADAIHLLARLGRCEITLNVGRRVQARWRDG